MLQDLSYSTNIIMNYLERINNFEQCWVGPKRFHHGTVMCYHYTWCFCGGKYSTLSVLRCYRGLITFPSPFHSLHCAVGSRLPDRSLNFHLYATNFVYLGVRYSTLSLRVVFNCSFSAITPQKLNSLL